MSLFPRTPKLESRNCPEIVPGGVSGLWELIITDCKVWSRRGLNQTCNPRQDLSNNVSHSQFEGQEEVDSWLLMVGSQTVSLTPGPSFAHNLGYRCPNDQCEFIFYIYASRPFQWHQEHLNTRCFGLCCRTLNIRESRRAPNPQLWKCWASPPHLAKVGLRHYYTRSNPKRACTPSWYTYFLDQHVHVKFNTTHIHRWNKVTHETTPRLCKLYEHMHYFKKMHNTC
jgi:hypothetical protein